MTGLAPVSAAVAERLALIDGLLYGDTFACAPTLDELRRHARVPVGRDELRRAVRSDPALRELVGERDGLYFLRGREALAEARGARLRRARRIERRARRVARVVGRLPSVRAVLLTGSVAAGDAPPDADADLLVVVARGRLATTFLVLGTTSRILRRSLFCPNYYVAEDRLEIAARDVYAAREVAQAVPLAGACRFHAANRWVEEVFPNWRAPAAGGALPRGGRSRAAARRLGDRVERVAARVVRARLAAHYGVRSGSVPADVAGAFEAGDSLRFHGDGCRDRVLQAHAARRAEAADAIAAVLARAAA